MEENGVPQVPPQLTLHSSSPTDKIAAAICKMQSQLHGAKKSSENPYFNSKYADLESVWEACRKPLTDNGLSVLQFVGGTAEEPALLTMLLHESGQSFESSMSMKPDKKGPQAVGSCITYMRRYMLAAITGVYQMDDDAESATTHPKGKAINYNIQDDIPMGTTGAPKDYITEDEVSILKEYLKENKIRQADFMRDNSIGSLKHCSKELFSKIVI